MRPMRPIELGISPNSWSFWSLDESNIYPRVGAPKQRIARSPMKGLIYPSEECGFVPTKGLFPHLAKQCPLCCRVEEATLDPPN